MKKWILLLTSVIIFGGFALLPSCTTEQPSTGLLYISVVDSNGVAMPDQQIFLANSLPNLKQGNYLTSGWTDSRGLIFFIDLLPLHYWFGAEHWNDYGGGQVWAGYEHIVTFVLNSPEQ